MLALLALFVGACARQSQVELTLVATNVSLNTQIAALRETATVQADRILVTVEYMGTLVRQAEDQNSFLRATLAARGVDTSGVGSVDPSQVTPIAPANNNAPPAATPEATGETQSLNPAEIVGPALTNIVMAEGVGSDDCALGAASSFSSGAERIYVVATAFNIEPGMTLVSRWQVAGVEVVHDFTPDFTIDDNCIWFFIDQTDAEFMPGNWNVQLEINGAISGSPVQFSIAE